MKALVTAMPGFVLPGESPIVLVGKGAETCEWMASHPDELLAIQSQLTVADIDTYVYLGEGGT